MIALLFVIAVIVFDIAAMLWGADSRPGLNDPEWARLQGWHGFAH